MSSFAFILTEKCNWNCEYCDFPGIENPKEATMLSIELHMPYIKKIIDKLDKHHLLSFIHVDGGELGLVRKEKLERWFRIFDREVVVSTNGKFLENKHHLNPVISPYIKQIWYHVNTDGLIKYDDNRVVYGLVHNDIDDIVNFVKCHEDIHFGYVELEYNINQSKKVDHKLYIEFYDKIKDIKNIADSAKENIKNRIEESADMRRKCYMYNTTCVVDLVNEQITLCQRAMKSTIPLTPENFIERLTKFPKDLFESNENCKSCTRLFRGKFLDSSMEDFFKVKRLFKQ
jgi:MoaA/NifB/PqqE/SkfB family radical SAM enzyme